MRQIVVLGSAKADLLGIQTYTLKMWGGAKVDELQDVVYQSLILLASSPFIGRKTSGKNIFIKILGRLPFLVVYKVTDTHVYIVKVIHTKRNR